MRDEHDDRIQQALRQDFGRDVAALFRSIAYAFNRLHAQLYAAPWKPQGAEQQCATRLTTM